jgi:hypothetical protein
MKLSKGGREYLESWNRAGKKKAKNEVTVETAKKWADLMESKMSFGRTVMEVAADTWKQAVPAHMTDEEKTSLQGTCGSILYCAWKYGKALNECLSLHFGERRR